MMKLTKSQLIDHLAAIDAEEAAEKEARIAAAVVEGRIKIVLAAMGEDQRLVEQHHRKQHPEDKQFELAVVFDWVEQRRPKLCTARSLARAEAQEAELAVKAEEVRAAQRARYPVPLGHEAPLSDPAPESEPDAEAPVSRVTEREASADDQDRPTHRSNGEAWPPRGPHWWMTR
jgi:hypothetical protein